MANGIIVYNVEEQPDPIGGKWHHICTTHSAELAQRIVYALCAAWEDPTGEIEEPDEETGFIPSATGLDLVAEDNGRLLAKWRWYIT